MRRVWPWAFILHAGELREAHRQERTRRVAEEYLPHLPGEVRGQRNFGPPVALRWSTIPLLGFPRAPFQVWRRSRDFRHDRELRREEVPVRGVETVSWGEDEMYEVVFEARPDTGRRLTVQALDSREQPIPGQRLEFTSGGIGVVRSPGIAALRVSGQGTLQRVRGISQLDFANLPGWQRVEVVGLPFQRGEAPAPVYDTAQAQGFEPPSLPGTEAALLRLKIARALALPLPDTGDASVPTPPWPLPDASRYLTRLRDVSPSPLGLIRECLERSEDLSLTRLQVQYAHEEKLEGIRQADIPGATPGEDPTRMELPVVGTIMLSVSNDSEAATGLGYGTVDFPPEVRRAVETRAARPPRVQRPPGMEPSDFDYMVTARYVLPFFGELELAALAQPHPGPTLPAGLRATLKQRNRAPARDEPESAVVQLQWRFPLQAQGYVVVAGHEPGSSRILNAERPLAGGFEPFIPQQPEAVEGAPPPEALATFTAPVIPVPLSGSRESRYRVVGRDVFGRWSSWARTRHTLEAPEVTKPGLSSARLELDAPSATGHVVPATLEVEFVWDWSDRSAERIVFTGRFFPADAEPDDSFTAGFGMTGGSSAGSPVVVTFSPLGAPMLDGDHTGTVEVLTREPPDPERRQYRLRVQGLSCDFTSASELAYAVYARGAEQVRPTVLSEVVGPRVARAADPIPAPAPSLPVEVQWTALPDTNGRARTVLRWPASAGATGYAVWEATEAALRVAVDPSLSPPAPGTPLLTRATELRNRVTASADAQARSLAAFSRLNPRPLPDNELEVVLPAGADTLFIYRVSTLSAGRVESERSADMILVAVPRRNVPGQPSLLLRVVDTPSPGVAVIALPGKGVAPAGYRVHRVRNPAAVDEVGLMGPPVIAADDPGWQPHLEPALHGGQAREGRRILDLVSPSWTPYFYRVVAVGRHAPSEGVYAGESLASALQQVVVPPLGPPLLDEADIVLTPPASTDASNRVLTFRTDLPVRRSPLGAALIRITRVEPSADGRRVERSTVLELSADAVPEGPPLTVLSAPTPEELAALPEINRRPPDAEGRARYTVRIPGDLRQGFITVINPLGRAAERPFPGET